MADILSLYYSGFFGKYKEKLEEWKSRTAGSHYVANSIDGPDTFQREVDPLLKVKDAYPKMILARMLYSCLVDADFLDTEAFMAEEPVPRGGGEPVTVLAQNRPMNQRAY